MKKLIPYLLSLIIGGLFGFLLFNNREISLSAFKEEVKVTAFQVGVFTSMDLAKEYAKKYDSSVIMSDEDVYRVYVSILTLNKTIERMENYLNQNQIAFYKKNILINDQGLIKALTSYEKSMLDGNDITLMSINKLILDSYGGNV